MISVVLCNSEMCCKEKGCWKKKIKSKKYGGIYKNIVVVLIVVDDWDI